MLRMMIHVLTTHISHQWQAENLALITALITDHSQQQLEKAGRPFFLIDISDGLDTIVYRKLGQPYVLTRTGSSRAIELLAEHKPRPRG